MFTRLIKRSGEIVFYDRFKIENAVNKALVAQNTIRSKRELRRIAEVTADYVTFELEKKYSDEQLPTVEDIQDVVEVVLMRIGEFDTVRSYIKYRYEHKIGRDVEHSALEMLSLFAPYVGSKQQGGISEGRAYCLQDLNHDIVAKATETFWLHSVYSENITRAHLDGDLTIHHLDRLSPDSCTWCLEELLKKGFGTIGGRLTTHAPKHFDAALMQLVTFINAINGECSGTHGINHFDTLLAPFILFDRLTYPEVKQGIQAFIFNLNSMTLRESQTALLNIVLDKEVPESHRYRPIIIGGEANLAYSYNDFQNEMDMINRALQEVILAGDATSRPFELTKLVYMSLNDCEGHCEPSLAIQKPKTGSLGTIAINLAQLSEEFVDLSNFYQRLENTCEMAIVALELKRKVLETDIAKGLYPYSRDYLQECFESHGEYWYNYSSRILLDEMPLCIVRVTKNTEDLTTEKGQEIAIHIQNRVNEICHKMKVKTNHNYQ